MPTLECSASQLSLYSTSLLLTPHNETLNPFVSVSFLIAAQPSPSRLARRHVPSSGTPSSDSGVPSSSSGVYSTSFIKVSGVCSRCVSVYAFRLHSLLFCFHGFFSFTKEHSRFIFAFISCSVVSSLIYFLFYDLMLPFNCCP